LFCADITFAPPPLKSNLEPRTHHQLHQPSKGSFETQTRLDIGMLEVFAYKRYKKHKLAKQLREQNATEALSKQDEAFIRKSIDTSNDDSNQAKPAMNPLSRFLHKGKSTESTVPSLTPEELAAIDEGIHLDIPVSNARY
jgi:hypothetical protein